MKVSHNSYQKLLAAYWLLKLTYGVFFIWSGSYKLVGSTEPLMGMVSSYFKQISPLPLTEFFTVFAWVELIIGSMILTFFTRLGAWLGVLLILAICTNLLMLGGFFTLVINNSVIIAGLIAFILLAGAKKQLYD